MGGLKKIVGRVQHIFFNLFFPVVKIFFFLRYSNIFIFFIFFFGGGSNFSKQPPSGPMLSISQNVRSCVCLSVCMSVCSLLRYRLNVPFLGQG